MLVTTSRHQRSLQRHVRSNTCQALALALASGLIACRDAAFQPTAAPSTTAHAALVPGEYWEVLTISASASGAFAHAINDAGVIVGYRVDDLGVSRAFRYQPGTMTVYPPAPGTHMSAYGINASGQVTGSVRINGVHSAYVRQANGMVIVLPHYGSPSTHNFASAINDLGEVVGFTSDFRGVRWSPAFGGWTVSSIGIPLTHPIVRVHDINNSGWIVGSASNNTDHQSLAFVQRPGQAIQTLGSLAGPAGNSTATSINNSGKVLGGSTTARGEPRHFSWTSFGGLKTEAGIAYWAASGAISDKGRIAGIDTINAKQRAFTVYQGIYNVLPLIPGGRAANVYGINSCGAIVGRIKTTSGAVHAVRWRRVVGNPPLGICD